MSHESNGSNDAKSKSKSKQQRRRPLQSRPLCTIVNGGGIAISKDGAVNGGAVSGDVKGKDAARDAGGMGMNVHVDAGALQTGRGGEQGSNNGNTTKPPKRFVAPDELPAFCAAIEGSCLTKIALVEELKRK